MLREIWQLFRAGILAFVEDEMLTRGAAIAFYFVTAIAPLLYICAFIAGLAMGHDAAQHAISDALGHIMSRDSVRTLDLAIRNARGTSTGIVGGMAGACILIVTASGVFGEMEDALNAIWHAPPKGAVLPRLLRGRARSLALVIALGVLLVISMAVASAVAVLQHASAAETQFGRTALALLNAFVSLLLSALLFAAIFKVLPNKELQWRDVFAGALGTALLFQLGQFLLIHFLGSSAIARPYGAAGGLILLLMWVYYSAQVFLLGAEFTKVYACRFGSRRDESRTTSEIGSKPGAESRRGEAIIGVEHREHSRI